MLVEKYNLLSYRSLMDMESKWYFFGLDGAMVSFMNTGVDLILGMNNLLASVVDYGLKSLYNLSIFDTRIASVFATTSTIWNTLFGSLKLLFFGIVMFYVIKDFANKGIQQAFIKLAIFVSIFSFNQVFFQTGDMYLLGANTISTEIQDKIVDASLIGLDEISVNLVDKNSVEYKNQSSNDKMRDAFFSFAVFKPFALINFGDKSKDLKEKDYNMYLVKGKMTAAGQEEIISNVEENSEDNPYFTASTIGNKYAIAIGALINTVFFGFIIFLLSLLKFVLEILVLGLCILLPISAILSLLPPFQNAIFGALKMIVGIFSIKVVSGLGISMIFLFVGLIDSVISPLTITGFFAGLITKAMLIWLIWKMRDKIVSFVTGGNINVNTHNKHTRKFDRKVEQLAGEGVAHAGQGLLNAGRSSLDNVKSRIEDSGSNIRDRAILNSANDIQEDDIREEFQKWQNNSDAPKNDVNVDSNNNEGLKEVNEDFQDEPVDDERINQSEYVVDVPLEDSTIDPTEFQNDSADTVDFNQTDFTKDNPDFVEDTEVEELVDTNQQMDEIDSNFTDTLDKQTIDQKIEIDPDISENGIDLENDLPSIEQSLDVESEVNYDSISENDIGENPAASNFEDVELEQQVNVEQVSNVESDSQFELDNYVSGINEYSGNQNISNEFVEVGDSNEVP